MPRPDIIVYPNTMARTTAMYGISIREDVLFADEKGVDNAGVRRQNEKVLAKLVPALQRTLLPDEVVLYATRAISQLSVLEQFTASAWTMLMAACAIVATNRRLLIFPVRWNGTWKESVRSVLWGDLISVKAPGMLAKNLKMQCADGSQVTYTRMTRRSGTSLEAIATAMIPAAIGEQSPYRRIVNLCADCRNVLTPRVYNCQTCGLIFKNEKTMRLYSIFLPGGGYFYVGYPLLGILLCIVEGVLLLGALASLGTGKAEEALPLLMTLAVVWVIVAGVTILHSQRQVREFIPAMRNPAHAGAFAAGAGPGSGPQSF